MERESRITCIQGIITFRLNARALKFNLTEGIVSNVNRAVVLSHSTCMGRTRDAV